MSDEIIISIFIGVFSSVFFYIFTHSDASVIGGTIIGMLILKDYFNYKIKEDIIKEIRKMRRK